MVRQSHRSQSLDVLRCIAILLVIGFHLGYYPIWNRFGWVGVDLFFVLSGFLISGLLFNEHTATGNISFKRFFCRRAMKIWPPFYVLVGTVALLFFCFQRSPFPWQPFLATSLFTQNYFQSYPLIAGGAFVHLWSLAVEEHFYLFLPLLFLFLVRRRRQAPFETVPLLFVVVSAVCLIARLLTVKSGTLAWTSHLRMDSLFAGVALRYVFQFRTILFRRIARTANLLIAAVLILPAACFDQSSRAMQTIGLTALWCGFAIVLAWSVEREELISKGGLLRLPTAIGFYSYSIYLWHLFFVLLFDAMGRSATSFWIVLASAIIFGAVMSKLVEWPVQILRDLWFPPGAEALAGNISRPPNGDTSRQAAPKPLGAPQKHGARK